MLASRVVGCFALILFFVSLLAPASAEPRPADLNAALDQAGIPTDLWLLLSPAAAELLAEETPLNRTGNWTDWFTANGYSVEAGPVVVDICLESEAPAVRDEARLTESAQRLVDLVTHLDRDLAAAMASGAWVPVSRLNPQALKALRRLSLGASAGQHFRLSASSAVQVTRSREGRSSLYTVNPWRFQPTGNVFVPAGGGSDGCFVTPRALRTIGESTAPRFQAPRAEAPQSGLAGWEDTVIAYPAVFEGGRTIVRLDRLVRAGRPKPGRCLRVDDSAAHYVLVGPAKGTTSEKSHSALEAVLSSSAIECVGEPEGIFTLSHPTGPKTARIEREAARWALAILRGQWQASTAEELPLWDAQTLGCRDDYERLSPMTAAILDRHASLSSAAYPETEASRVWLYTDALNLAWEAGSAARFGRPPGAGACPFAGSKTRGSIGLTLSVQSLEPYAADYPGRDEVESVLEESGLSKETPAYRILGAARGAGGATSDFRRDVRSLTELSIIIDIDPEWVQAVAEWE